VPWCFISGDRPQEEVEEMLSDLGWGLRELRGIYPINDKTYGDGLHALLEQAIQYKPEFIFIEGLAFLLGAKHDQKDYGSTAHQLAYMTWMCIKGGFTILGSLHSPKMKPDAVYENPREHMLGSVSWGGFSSTDIIVRPRDPLGIDTTRDLYIYPRNAPPEQWSFEMDSHGVPTSFRMSGQQANSGATVAALFLLRRKSGEVFRTSEFVEFCTLEGFSNASSERYLKKLESEGYVTRVAHGQYRVNRLT
jgi:hypothetical protein